MDNIDYEIKHWHEQGIKKGKGEMNNGSRTP
jgi:hypothetical protein